MPATKIAWSDLGRGSTVRWRTPTFLKHGTVVERKGRSLRVRFDGDHRDTVIPDARWYFAQSKTARTEAELDRMESSLVAWKGAAPKHQVDLQPDATGDDWLTSGEASKLHGVSPKDLRRWLRSGKVQGHQRSGAWIVSAVSLSQHLSERKAT